jgi:F-type H+-transporting ATPase subunit delta
MPTTLHYSPTAQAYARALLELAKERNEPIEPLASDLSQLRDAIDADPSVHAFLADPGISEAERTPVLERAFSGKVSPLLYNFMQLLNTKGRLGLLPQISAAYADLVEEALGKIEVDVTTAQRLTPEQLEQVRQKVSQALKRDAVVHQYVDDSIIGGLMLRVQDQLIDASVRYQLQAMKEQLLAARPH